MSELISHTKEQISRRELEEAATQVRFAKLKTLSSSIYHVLFDYSQETKETLDKKIIRIKKFIEKSWLLGKVCSDNKLKNREGVYSDDDEILGVSVPYAEIDKKIARKEYPFASAFFLEPAHLRGFLTRKDTERKAYRDLLADLENKENPTEHDIITISECREKLNGNSLNPVCSDADVRVQKRLDDFTEILKLGEFEMDEISRDHIYHGFEAAEKLGKKVVFILSHHSHTDTNIVGHWFRWMIQEGIVPHQKNLPKDKQKIIRFVGGIFMCMTKGIRHLVKGNNVSFVVGGSEIDTFHKAYNSYSKDIPENKKNDYLIDGQPVADKYLLTKMQKYGLASFTADPQKEIAAIYISGTRADERGTKKPPPGAGAYVKKPECMYFVIHLTGTKDMRVAKDSMSIRKHILRQPQKIRIGVAPYFQGGEKTIDDVYHMQIALRDKMEPEWIGAENLIDAQNSVFDAYNKYEDVLEQEKTLDLLYKYLDYKVDFDSLPDDIQSALNDAPGALGSIAQRSDILTAEHTEAYDRIEDAKALLAKVLQENHLGEKARTLLKY